MSAAEGNAGSGEGVTDIVMATSNRNDCGCGKGDECQFDDLPRTMAMIEDVTVGRYDHTHLTRNIKPKGECVACDILHHQPASERYPATFDAFVAGFCTGRTSREAEVRASRWVQGAFELWVAKEGLS